MAFLDTLIGRDQIEKQRRIADEAARERFDPNIFNPQVDEARRIAEEGIADEQIRAKALERILNTGEVSPSGLSQGLGSGRALSFLDKLNQQQMRQVGQTETNIALEEEKAKREGRQLTADLQTQRAERASQREAKIRENRLLAEAEASKRKQQLGATVGKLAGTVAGSFFGPGGAALAGAAGGGLFGGGQGAAIGGLTGATQALDIGGQEGDFTRLLMDRAKNRILGQEAAEARASVPNPKPEDEIIPADINPELEQDFVQDLFNSNIFSF